MKFEVLRLEARDRVRSCSYPDWPVKLLAVFTTLVGCVGGVISTTISTGSSGAVVTLGRMLWSSTVDVAFDRQVSIFGTRVADGGAKVETVVDDVGIV